MSNKKNYKHHCEVPPYRRASLTTTVEKTIREIMFNITQRLLDSSSTKLPLVDTHCHFDPSVSLSFFLSLHIHHDNVTQDFSDYHEYYPANLDLELVIQVFWRPNHLSRFHSIWRSSSKHFFVLAQNTGPTDFQSTYKIDEFTVRVEFIRIGVRRGQIKH